MVAGGHYSSRFVDHEMKDSAEPVGENFGSDSGFTYLINMNLQLDISADVGLNLLTLDAFQDAEFGLRRDNAFQFETCLFEQGPVFLYRAFLTAGN